MKKLLQGYSGFRKRYATGDESVMHSLSLHGQQPDTMVVACCDSRVDPSLILQCNPGDLFVVRNVANIVPPYERDEKHHGTSAALEFGVCYLNVRNLIILGHSQCGGINALLHKDYLKQNDFISNWVSLIDIDSKKESDEAFAQRALSYSYDNCLTFPWIKERVNDGTLKIHRWFFNIQAGEIFVYDDASDDYKPLL